MQPTDVIHAKIVFQDRFSFAKETRIKTISRATFEKMQRGVGHVVSFFKNDIRWEMEVIEVTQATPEDYKNANQ